MQASNKPIGADARVARTTEALADGHGRWLIGLDGPPGIGKTSVARACAAWAADQADQFRSVIWETVRRSEFVWPAVRGQPRPALTPGQILDAIAFRLDPDAFPSLPAKQKHAAVQNVLKERPHLIVVDNIEQAADYDVLADLLWSLANPSKVLVTCSQPLTGRAHVHAIPVAPLSDADGVTLLRRVADQNRLAELATADEEVALEIQRACAGNPLCLRLAAGQAASLPLSQLLDSLRMAGATHEDLPRSLHRQTWERLPADGRALLVCMPALPPEEVAWQDVAAVTEFDDDHLKAAVAVLAARSLLQAGEGSSMTITIHSTTRAFVLSELVQPVAIDGMDWRSVFRTAAERATSHVIEIVQQSTTNSERMEAKRAHALQAMENCAALGDMPAAVVKLALAWHGHMVDAGHWTVWPEYLELALAAARKLGDRLVIGRMLARLGELHALTRAPQRALAVFEEAWAYLGSAGDEPDVVDVLCRWTNVHIEDGALDRAERLLVEALSRAERQRDPAAQAPVHRLLGMVELKRGRPETADGHLRRARSLAVEAKAPGEEREVLQGLATVAFQAGEWERALDLYRQALQNLEEHPRAPQHSFAKARLLDEVAWIRFLSGDLAAAEAEAQRALAMAEAGGRRELVARLAFRLGVFYEMKNDYEQAVALTRRAMSFYEAGGDMAGVARSHSRLAFLNWRRGAWSAAGEHFRQSAELNTRWGNSEALAQLRLSWVRYLLYKGEMEASERQMDQLMILVQGLGQPLLLGTAYSIFGVLRGWQGDWPTAVEYCRMGLALHRNIGSRPSLMYAYQAVAWACLGLGQLDEAQEAGQAALDTWAQISQGPDRLNVVFRGTVLRVLGEVVLEKGDHDRAQSLLQESLDILVAARVPLEQGFVLLPLARLAGRRGDLATAQVRLMEARDIFGRLGADLCMRKLDALAAELRIHVY